MPISLVSLKLPGKGNGEGRASRGCPETATGTGISRTAPEEHSKGVQAASQLPQGHSLSASTVTQGHGKQAQGSTTCSPISGPEYPGLQRDAWRRLGSPAGSGGGRKEGPCVREGLAYMEPGNPTEGSGTSKREPGEAGTGDASAAPRPAALTAPTGVPPPDQRHGHSPPPQPRERRDAGTPRSHHGRRRGSEESRRNPAARRPGPGAVPPAACHAHARPAPPPRGPMREREAETDGSGGQ